MSFGYRLFKGATKVGIVAGAAYALYVNDVWSLNPEKTQNVYQKVTREIMPGTVELKENLPSPNELTGDVTSKWNDVVGCTFNFISTIPERLNRTLSYAAEAARGEKSN